MPYLTRLTYSQCFLIKAGWKLIFSRETKEYFGQMWRSVNEIIIINQFIAIASLLSLCIRNQAVKRAKRTHKARVTGTSSLPSFVSQIEYGATCSSCCI